MTPLNFYFDFMSPFAYLAHQKLPGMARRYGYELTYHPIDLPAAKLAAGNTGPPNVKVPVKIRYLRTDLERWARRYKLDLAFPGSLDTGAVNRGFFFAQAGEQARYVSTAWQQIWGMGGDPADKSLHTELAQNMGWDASAFLDFMASAPAAVQFAESNRQAQAKGVFGAPIMTIGDAMWWGNDRLEFLEEHMRTKNEERCSREE